MKNKNKVFLAYGYSAKNAGDLAICVGAIDLLIEQGFGVVLLSKYDRNDSEFTSSKAYYHERYGEKVEVLEAPFTLNRQEGVLEKLIHNFQGFLVTLGVKNGLSKNIEKEIKESNFVIFNGGNLLRCSSYTDYARLIALYYPLKLAKKFDKEYLIFPHSSADINSLGRGIIGKIVKGAKTVFAREEISFKKLKDEFDLTNIENSIDLAFFINNGGIASERESANQDVNQVIGFTFRAHTVGDIEEFDEQEKEKIYRNVLKTVNGVGIDNRYIFVVQTLKDRDFTLELKTKVENEVGKEYEFYENYDPIELIEFYSTIDLLVGMRLHSIILAASVGTPAYGVFYKEWGLKNPGLMEKLGLPYFFMDTDGEVNVQAMKSTIQERSEFEQRIQKIIGEEKSKLIKAL